MNIHKIYERIFKIWRQKRMARYEEIISPCSEDVVLDVGGFPKTWTSRPQTVARIDCVNIDLADWDNSEMPEYHITTGIADGCDLSYSDRSYDILFSNSVIEHVGDWNKQCAFASEAMRVGKKLWIQTPAYECPLEPHYLAPFVHWLPVPIRRKILRWFTPWGWMTKPPQAKVDETINFTRLLTKRQISELFPGCQIMTERLLWIIPKSYVVYRVDVE